MKASQARRSTTGRNAGVMAATAACVGLLFLYPTSLNHQRRSGPTHAAPTGIVAGSVPSAASSPPPAAVARTLTVNGQVAVTRYGPVQVQIRYRTGRILAATAIVYPTDSGQDREINGYAIPLLERETLQVQSAHIDVVSGATYTSDGYERSLQAALDAARRAG